VVTFAEWDFAQGDEDWSKLTGLAPRRPDDEKWGRGNRPVIDVSWDDAKAYATWLSGKTGQTYGLLSEAEWEYCCRAGRATPFWWGSSITPSQANYNGNYDYAGGGEKGEFRGKTVPVDTFSPNPFGLYQMHGNVWEWVEDVYHGSYDGAPSDGTAWTTGDSGHRVLRGGSWFLIPWVLRAARRFRNYPGNRNNDVGFRLSRRLNP
jgi:formylglycine-generating enzyme required for sulfatase activity